MNEEMKKDLERLAKVLDSVLDNLFDACGQRDEEAESALKDIRTKYGL